MAVGTTTSIAAARRLRTATYLNMTHYPAVLAVSRIRQGLACLVIQDHQPHEAPEERGPQPIAARHPDVHPDGAR